MYERKSQTKFRLALGVTIGSLVALFLSASAFFLSYEPIPVEAFIEPEIQPQPEPPQETIPEPVSVGVPVRLSIERIGVDAEIEQVSLTEEGAMDVPKDPMNAGWFAFGPRPGEIGSATLAGHVDWIHGASGVFADLHTLELGDRITVVDDAGNTAIFVVRKTRTYAASAEATEVFSSLDGTAHLNLITCNGAWDKSANQYAERFVVFSDRVTDEWK